MQITILGATGNIGRPLTEILLSRGHRLIIVVHRKKGTYHESNNLHIVEGDVRDEETIKKAIVGSDVVVSALSSWKGRPKNVVSSAVNNLIPLMQAAGIKRFVSITGSAAKLHGESLTSMQSLSRLALGTISKGVLNDADVHLRLLADSSLDWTVIRAPRMTNRDSAGYHLSLRPSSPLSSISRKAVVLAMLAVIDYGTFSKQAPFITPK